MKKLYSAYRLVCTDHGETVASWSIDKVRGSADKDNQASLQLSWAQIQNLNIKPEHESCKESHIVGHALGLTSKKALNDWVKSLDAKADALMAKMEMKV